MTRVVLDTDVVLSGLISARGASRRLLLGALDHGFELLLSTALLMEYESVLCRPQHLARAGAQIADIAEILDALASICTPVVFDYRWRPTGANRDDEMVVETAINGQADMLATFNRKDMREAGDLFGFRVEDPGMVLRSLQA